MIEKFIKMNRVEILPPIVENGVEKHLIIHNDAKKKEITIFYQECFERIGDDRYKSHKRYNKFSSLEVPYEMIDTLCKGLKKYTKP